MKTTVRAATALAECFGMCSEAAIDMARALARESPVAVMYGGDVADARRFADLVARLGLRAKLIKPPAELPEHVAWAYVRGLTEPDGGAIALLRAKLAKL